MAINDYYDGLDQLPPGNLKISPSSFADYFEHTNQWVREHLMDEDGFGQSTATHLGTVVHAYVEKVMLNQDVTNFDTLELEPYLLPLNDGLEVGLIDKAHIRSSYPILAQVLIDNFVTDHNTPHSTEQFIHYEIIPGVSVGGTYDYLRVNQYNQLMVGDWKTAATKPSALTKKYQWQALIYCWILHKNGTQIQGYEVNFAVKPTKTLPARAIHFPKIIQQSDLDFIESLLRTVAHAMLAFKQHPTLRFLIAQDYRLYQGPLQLEPDAPKQVLSAEDI